MAQQTENTLVIIKPDYYEKRVPILQILLLNGFRITHRKILSFSPEQAAEFYKNLEKSDPYFALKVMSISKGRAEAVVVNKENAVRDLQLLINSPMCCNYFNADIRHKIHASISKKDANDEIRYLFSNVIQDPTREVHFGYYCGRQNLTGLLAEATFYAFEDKTEDVRSHASNWILKHSYKFESDNWCPQ